MNKFISLILKKIALIFLFANLAACQNFQLPTNTSVGTGTKKTSGSDSVKTQSQPKVNNSMNLNQPNPPLQADTSKEKVLDRNVETKDVPAAPIVGAIGASVADESYQVAPQETEALKVGIILGPGALRAFAHIGVLQEFAKSKIPVIGVVGIEMGSLVASIYTFKGQIYDVEWQMFKLPEDSLIKRDLIGQGYRAQDLSVMSDFIKNIFGTQRAESSKIGFSCPAYNLSRHQAFMMNRGAYSTLLPYCMGYSPFYKPFQSNIASVLSLDWSARYLRQKGANYLVFVNVISQGTAPFLNPIDSEENAYWSMIAQGLEGQQNSINHVVNVPLSGYYLSDFSKRREIMQIGQEAGKKSVSSISQQLGL